MWIAWNGRTVEAAVATILINSEAGKLCVVTACGGSDMKRWLPLIEQIEAYARRESCKRVRIYRQLRDGCMDSRALTGNTVSMDKAVG